MLEDFHSTAAELIRDFGTAAKLVKQPTGDYNTATGTVDGVEQEINVELILLDLTLQSNGLSVKYNTLVEAGDKEAYVLPNRVTPFTIGPSDRIRVGGIEYKVVTMKEINPTATEPVVFTLYLRK